MSDYDWLDLDDGDSPWVRSTDHAHCSGCGHVGPVEVETAEEWQGEGAMSGSITIATGRVRCAECEDERNLQHIPATIVEAVKALASETLYEAGEMQRGVSVKFLVRITLLKAAVGIEQPEAMVEEAQRLAGKPGEGQ